MKQSKEWTVDCPWGKLAMTSWGDPKNTPILLVHGFMDTADTFVPMMLENMPNNYYYVGLDLPGHGKSDAFPYGMLPLQMHLVEAINIAVESLKWDRFIFLGHSLALIVGILYNAAFRDQIICFISLDPVHPLGAHSELFNYEKCYGWIDDYYSNYDKYNSPQKEYKYEDAITAVAKRRGLSNEEVTLITKRNLMSNSDGRVKFMLDNKMRKLATTQIPRSVLIHLMTINQPHFYILVAEDYYSENREAGLIFLKEVESLNKNFQMYTLAGGHDFHIVNAAEVANIVQSILKKVYRTEIKSKM